LKCYFDEYNFPKVELRVYNLIRTLFWGYLLGSSLMIIAAIVTLFLGVNAEGKSLEEVAAPISEEHTAEEVAEEDEEDLLPRPSMASSPSSPSNMLLNPANNDSRRSQPSLV
jgi:hypothetical protein